MPTAAFPLLLARAWMDDTRCGRGGRGRRERNPNASNDRLSVHRAPRPSTSLAVSLPPSQRRGLLCRISNMNENLQTNKYGAVNSKFKRTTEKVVGWFGSVKRGAVEKMDACLAAVLKGKNRAQFEMRRRRKKEVGRRRRPRGKGGEIVTLVSTRDGSSIYTLSQPPR